MDIGIPAPYGEHQRLAVAERPRRVEDLQRSAAERDPVFAFRFHPHGRKSPDATGQVHLLPRRQPHLAGPRGRQHQKLERQLDRRRSLRRRPHRLAAAATSFLGQRPPVLHDVNDREIVIIMSSWS